MICEHAKELLSDHLDGTLTKAQSADLRAHLDTCPSCRLELAQLSRTLELINTMPADEPSPRLKENFTAMLQEEIRTEKKRQSLSSTLRSWTEHVWASMTFRPALQFAYSLMLMLAGVFVGARFLSTNTTAPSPINPTQQELADLRTKVDSMSQLVAYSLTRQETDSVRLRQVGTVLGSGKVSSKQLAGLVSTLAFDPSTNVRLSALEALYAHADMPIVREGVLVSLPRERSPLVQLAMIDFLTSMRETQAAPAFEALSRDTKTDKAVRDAARLALTQL